MDIGIAGRSYVVLGGTRGVGWETVRLLAEEGANVAVLSRNANTSSAAFADLSKRNGVRVIGVAADASAPGSVEAAVSAAQATLGPLRGMAVTNHWMGPSRNFSATDETEWELYFQHSLMAAVRAGRAILPHLADQGGGSFVLTTAYSSRAPKPYIPAYAAFKAALNNLTKSLAKTYGAAGVRVNAVAPGALRTGRYEERLADLRQKQPEIGLAEAERTMLGAMDMKVALERIGDPSEVADLIVFLLSERAAYTTGVIANIDGGTDF
jgi:NAD(P)-dependent dehydrogenase (short-subunit alcohol dehydrogenase family)